MNMTKEQPQIRFNPEEIEVEAEKAAAAAAATAGAGGEAFDDLEAAAARDEGKEADAGEAADNTSVDGTNALSSPSTKRCNRCAGVIFGSSILLLLAALVGGGYSLQRSRNQISTAMNKPPADCKGKDAEKDKCAGKSTCSSDDVGLYLNEKYVGKALEEGKNQVGKYVALAHTAILDAIMFELTFKSADVAVELACRENVMVDDVGVALGTTGFKFNVIRRVQKLDLKVNKAAEKLVKDVNNQGRGFGGRGRGCHGRGRGGRGGGKGQDGGRGRGGRGRREVELEKDATTLIQHAVENSFKSIYGYARKAADGGTIRPKHVVIGAKKALPSPYFKIVMVALVETIISCACEGKLKINLSKLVKWLKSLGMMMDRGDGSLRRLVHPTATLTFGAFRKGTAQSILIPTIADARAAGKSVIEKSDITASVVKDADLKAYFEKLPAVEYIHHGLPKEAAVLARELDSGIGLTLAAELYVDQLSSRALQHTVEKTFEYAEEKKMAEIKADAVTFVVKKAPKSIAGRTNGLVKVALKSFKECKKKELPEIDDDLQLTEELLLEFDAIDFEDEGEDPED